MINSKKLDMAYKRYSKNFVEGIPFDEVLEEYEESEREIIDIVHTSQLEKDHILLINLETISSYYLSQWKNDVLIHGMTSTEQLKKIQMVVFYQCMAQDLYLTRYPELQTEYTFSEVITALIHFAMFGWDREEYILLNFIADNLGGRLLRANDWNTHIWFLIELYLEFKDTKISETNQPLHLAVKNKLMKSGQRFDLIPKNLGVYEEVLERWTSNDMAEIELLMEKMVAFHSELVSEIGQSTEFGDYRYGFYPYEVLFLTYVRNKLGLQVPWQFEGLLMNNPEAKMQIGEPEPYPEWDPLLRHIDNFYRKHYPGYIPNKHPDLFL